MLYNKEDFLLGFSIEEICLELLTEYIKNLIRHNFKLYFFFFKKP